MPSQKGFIWPKDPMAGRPKRGWWGRIDDVRKGKGSDIFVGRLDTQHATPKTAVWSNWTDRRYQSPTNRELESYTILGPMCGSGTKKIRRRYDFRTRRYVDIDKVVRDGMAGGMGAAAVWMDVEYCEHPRCNNPRPLVYTDGFGQRHPRYWDHNHHAEEWAPPWGFM